MRPLDRHAEEIWTAGVRAVDPADLIRKAVSVGPRRLRIADTSRALHRRTRVVVVGAGKASGNMARALETRLRKLGKQDRLSGVVNVPGSEANDLAYIRLHTARTSTINEPTKAAVRGTDRMLEAMADLRPDDLVLALVSGGGSSLLVAPAPGITFVQKRAVTRLLARAGATIDEMNCVRKHLSRVKGGGMLRATRARIHTLVISDVVGNPLDVIASGPTVPDPTTFDDALDVLRAYGLLDRMPDAVLRHLRRGARGSVPETVKRVGSRARVSVLGDNGTALEAAAVRARTLGYRVVMLGSRWEGEAREVGGVLAGLARSARDDGVPHEGPLCLLAGGETTVTLGRGAGKGGRNQELAVSVMERFWEDGMAGVAFLSGGTDGEDGPTDAAGGLIDASMLARARRLGLSPGDALDAHDTYPLLKQAGGLLQPGPTGTNVMDVQVMLVDRPRPLSRRGIRRS